MVSLSAPSGIVEGDYITWSKKWIAAIPGNLYYEDEYDIWIDEKHNLIYFAWMAGNHANRWGIFNIADFSTVFLSASGSDYPADAPYLQATHITPGAAYFESGGISRSAQTYLLLLRSDYYTFEVWRNGSKLKSRDIRNDFHTTNCYSSGGCISLTGKYLLFQVRDYDGSPDLHYLMLYKGA